MVEHGIPLGQVDMITPMRKVASGEMKIHQLTAEMTGKKLTDDQKELLSHLQKLDQDHTYALKFFQESDDQHMASDAREFWKGLSDPEQGLLTEIAKKVYPTIDGNLVSGTVTQTSRSTPSPTQLENKEV